MSELQFIAPVNKKDYKHPSWRGIPRVSFTRPAVAHEIDPIVACQCPAKEIQLRDSLKVGTIVIIVDGENKGKRAVVVAQAGAGIVKVAGPVVPAFEISQDFLIATSTHLEIPAGASEAQVEAAAAKVPEMVEYLKAPFSLKKGDYPHKMKF